MKICSKCGLFKPYESFGTCNKVKSGLKSECRQCTKSYYIKNKEYIKRKSNSYYERNKDKVLTKAKQYQKDNKEKVNAKNRKWRDKNREIINAKLREKRRNNAESYRKQCREYVRRRRKEPLFKLKGNIRTLIKNSLRNNSKHISDIIGCSYQELLLHLNNNIYGFKYGQKDLDIDHIIPLSNASSREEVIKLNHFTNLQLLPSLYNRVIKKDKKFNKKHFERWLEKQKEACQK